MKKFRFLLVMLLGIFMTFAFAACGTTPTTPDTGDNSGIVIGGGDETQTPDKPNSGNDSGTPDKPNGGDENNENDDKSDKDAESDILIVYFSATNNTKSVAEKIHAECKSDLYEIVPAIPYTSADINYTISNCRANTEQRDKNSRPPINGQIENFAEYDVIFIGYPIWGNDAPRIIYTFLDSYDFSGKTLIPFCTSGGSGISGSERSIKAYKTDVTWLSGREFSRSTNQSTIAAWLNGLNY